MATGVTILVVAGDTNERINLKKAFLVEKDFEVVGDVDNAVEALKLAVDLNPTIVIINSQLKGENPDGIECAEVVSVQAPKSDIVMVSTDGSDGLFLRKAMLAGVRQVVPAPYDAGDLVEIVKLVATRAEQKREVLARIVGVAQEEEIVSKLVTIFSSKGGVGRTLLAINLAVALRQRTGKKVCLVDLDLQFGDVAIMMHLQPKNTIAALAREIADAEELDADLLGAHLTTHEESGISVLTAPVRPDEADLVKGAHVDQILKKLKEKFHYIVVDTPAHLSDTVLTALELADMIILLLTMELPTIKDGKLMMEIMQTFGYSGEKIKVVMNRESPTSSFKKKDVEETLETTVAATIPSEGEVVMPSVNEGEPFMIQSPDSDIAAAINEIAALIAPEAPVGEGEEGEEAAPAKKKKGGGLFGFGKK